VNFNTLKLIYFSPTKTTLTVLQGIADGIGAHTVGHIDLTPPGAIAKALSDVGDDIAVIGVPVYSGRVPMDAVERFKRIKAAAVPAIIVVVYGNREYEDALLELKNLASGAGFTPIAGGAFIGEHSFSNPDMPIAPGRPDADDLKKARELGAVIRKNMAHRHASDAMPPLTVPGSFPYRERPRAVPIAPMTQEALCTGCGTCAGVCPSAAITVDGGVETEATACIKCCACVKYCPTTARTMADERMQGIRKKLFTNCSARKEPEVFLS
jgi:ferredoxin